MLAAIFALLACRSIDPARADVEPNDNIVQAEGPVRDHVYSGTLQNAGDVDWYWVSLGSKRHVTITASYSRASCRSPVNFEVLNFLGDKMATIAPSSETAPSILSGSTTIATDRRYIDTYDIRVSAAAATPGCEYSFLIGPPGSYVERYSPDPVRPIPARARLRSKALPMRGEIDYQGYARGPRRPIWLKFIARPRREISYELTNFCTRGPVRADIRDTTDSVRFKAGVQANHRFDSPFFQRPGVTVFYMAIRGPVGCGFQAEVEPTWALISEHAGWYE